MASPCQAARYGPNLQAAEEAAGTNLTSPAGGALPGDGKVALEPLGGSNWKSEV